MKLLRKLFPFFSVLAVFASCSARIEGLVTQGGAAEVSVNTSLGRGTVLLIRSLHDFMGEESSASVLDGQAIGRSMSAAPGIAGVSLHNTTPSSLEGTISVSALGDFLATGSSGTSFITFTEGTARGTSSIVITLDRNSVPALLPMLSGEVEEYLTALMAPALLGETSTKEEYLSLLTMVYGKDLADEISGANVLASVDVPRPVSAVVGGLASGRRAEFNIPLIDLLVLERPLRYELSW